MKIDRQERFQNIADSLMEFDELFHSFAKMGRCIFTDSIPTACISFNNERDEMGFYWNPDFFDESSDYKNRFILCHEMLHVFFKHGRRGKGLNGEKANICMDISINHFLVDNFGFERAMIEGWSELCWRDTVFNTKIPPMPSFEGYYNVEDSFFNKGFSSLDIHEFSSGMKNEAEEEEVVWEMPEQSDILDKASDCFGTIPGIGLDEKDFISRICKPVPKKKPKFETILKNVTKSVKEKSIVYEDSWVRPDRRLAEIMPDLPEWKKSREKKEKGKYSCLMFIDNSGSCDAFIERFCNCANSLDEKVFEVEVFSFDTRVYKVEKIEDEYKVSGGGGTDFNCVVREVESRETQPDVVFVLTDGYAGQVYPKRKKIWNWLITENGSCKSVLNAGKIWKLCQFE